MSQNDPYKQKPRSAKKTLLVFGEGLGEEMFLKRLKGLYAFNSDVVVTIGKGKGGTPRNVVLDAQKRPGAFDSKVVFVDNDKSEKEMQEARDEARKRGIIIIENTPCLEALLLSILNGGKSFTEKKSKWCKSEFESIHIKKEKRSEAREYEKLFTKELLEEQRLRIPELDYIINLIEGNTGISP